MATQKTRLKHWIGDSEWKSEVLKEFQMLFKSEDNSKWNIGDKLLEKETIYGEQTIQNIAKTFSRDYHYLLDIKHVSKTFEISVRTENLSWYHFRMASYTDRPLEWVKLAEQKKWSVRELVEAIEGSKPKRWEDSVVKEDNEKFLEMATKLFRTGSSAYCTVINKLLKCEKTEIEKCLTQEDINILYTEFYKTQTNEVPLITRWFVDHNAKVDDNFVKFYDKVKTMSGETDMRYALEFYNQMKTFKRGDKI